MRKEDLVYLAYSPNECYVTVAEEAPGEIEIDLKNGTYAFSRHDGTTRHVLKLRIGNGRVPSYPRPKSLIGAYDRTNLEHLRNLVSDAQDAVRRQGPVIED